MHVCWEFEQDCFTATEERDLRFGILVRMYVTYCFPSIRICQYTRKVQHKLPNKGNHETLLAEPAWHKMLTVKLASTPVRASNCCFASQPSCTPLCTGTVLHVATYDRMSTSDTRLYARARSVISRSTV